MIFELPIWRLYFNIFYIWYQCSGPGSCFWTFRTVSLGLPDPETSSNKQKKKTFWQLNDLLPLKTDVLSTDKKRRINIPALPVRNRGSGSVSNFMDPEHCSIHKYE
jgi:hypothetical protein